METNNRTGSTRQYLSFILDKELFAFEVLRVREVLEVTRITRVPKTPKFMIGVINLRGGVVPVIDLRLKFELKAIEPTVETSIIILETQTEGETMVIGALVDAVKAVIHLESTDIEEAPKVGMRLGREFISGIGKKGDQFVILLDSDRVFSKSEMDLFSEAGESPVAQPA